MDPRFVHIVGTGTIGAPLIEICAMFRREFGLEGVTFCKKQPHRKNRAEIKIMQDHGALLAVEEESMAAFREAGYVPNLTTVEARAQAAVIIDCTPKKNGLNHKKLHYEPLVECGSCARAIAQGSEEGFGPPFAEGINNHVLTPENQYLQVVSCNSHWAAAALEAASDGRIEEIEDADFVYGRRSGDVSQEDGQQNDVTVDEHKDEFCGTHQAHDVGRVFATRGFDNLPLFSSTSIVPSQLMHATRCKITLRGKHTREEIIARFERSPLIACTYKRRTGTSFSFGRDHSINGRILTPAIVSIPTLWVGHHDGKTVIAFWGFTSQDGNSLRSSIAAMLSALDFESWRLRIAALAPYMFAEI